MDRLFSFGVVGDDLTPRERAPQLPVRCLEDELVGAPVDLRERCAECLLNPRPVGFRHCAICRRDRQQRDRGKRAADRERSERRVVGRIQAQKGILATRQNEHLIERLLEAGVVRWATETERVRLGFRAVDNVVMMR